MKEVIKKLEESGYFIQGSFVLDKIFNKNWARDIDVFLIRKTKEEVLKVIGINKEKPYDFVDLGLLDRSVLTDEEILVGIYNTDRYFLVEGKIIFPQNYPSVPTCLWLIPEMENEEIGVEEVIRGIKTSLRYGLKPTKKLKEKWKIAIEKVFNETIRTEECIRQILKGKTPKKERKKISQELKKYYPNYKLFLFFHPGFISEFTLYKSTEV